MIFNTGAGGGAAKGIRYDNTQSGLEAVNVQEGIDELHTNLNMRWNSETDMIQIYNSGEWVNWEKAGLLWDGIILKNGAKGQDVSFSGGSGSLTIGTGSYYALKPINTTGWNYLHIRVINVNIASSSNWGAVGLYSSTASDTHSYNPSEGLFVDGKTVIQSNGSWTIDISNTQGTYYAGFYMSSGSMTITDFYVS